MWKCVFYSCSNFKLYLNVFSGFTTHHPIRHLVRIYRISFNVTYWPIRMPARGRGRGRGANRGRSGSRGRGRGRGYRGRGRAPAAIKPAWTEGDELPTNQERVCKCNIIFLFYNFWTECKYYFPICLQWYMNRYLPVENNVKVYSLRGSPYTHYSLHDSNLFLHLMLYHN